MNGGSKINPLLTLEYMKTENENKYFDRKSGQIRVADLAPHISAFANADGGTLVIGISDKNRILEGVNFCGDKKINEFINAPKDCCRPMPRRLSSRISFGSSRARNMEVDGLLKDQNTRNFLGSRVSLMLWLIVTMPHRDSLSRSACTMIDWKLKALADSRTL